MVTLLEQIALIVSKMEAEILDKYKDSSTPVESILEEYGISYDRLYRILRDSGTPLRRPRAQQIIVLDPANGNAPTWVEKNAATVKLRSKQLQTAYYIQQELVTHICKTFHISWRTLYRICPPNRRNYSVPSLLGQDNQQLETKKTE